MLRGFTQQTTKCTALQRSKTAHGQRQHRAGQCVLSPKRTSEKHSMSSLLGLAGYDSDHSDGDDANPQQQTERSPRSDDNSNDTSAPREDAGPEAVGAGGDREENSDSRLGDSIGDEGGVDREARVGVLRASSFDAPAPPSKESRQFFMPLPSPLVRLDTASPSASSPFITYDPPNGGGSEGAEGKDGVGEEGGKGGDEEEGDGDIIKPEYRDMLPPEATGHANPQLQAKIAKFLDTMQGDFTKSIKGKKDYGNPAVLAQVRNDMVLPHRYLKSTQGVVDARASGKS